jgi:hypothetical protein
MTMAVEFGEWTPEARNRLDLASFAGPHRTFPIVTQRDVDDAMELLARTRGDGGRVTKARVVAIALLKGLKVPRSC